MNITDVNNAIREAESLQRMVDYNSENMAKMLTGRLRNINDNWILSNLKRELTQFNAKTGEWKS